MVNQPQSAAPSDDLPSMHSHSLIPPPSSSTSSSLPPPSSLTTAPSLMLNADVKSAFELTTPTAATATAADASIVDIPSNSLPPPHQPDLETLQNNHNSFNNYEFKQKLEHKLNLKLSPESWHRSPRGNDIDDCPSGSSTEVSYRHQNSECELVPSDPYEQQKLELVANTRPGAVVKRYWWLILLFVLYNLFLGLAIYRTWSTTPNYFDGVKLLTILNGLAYLRLIYVYLIKPFFLKHRDLGRAISESKCLSHNRTVKWFKIILWSLVQMALLAYIIRIAWNDYGRLRSIVGYFMFVLVGFAFSKHRRSIKWSQIVWGLTIQLMFGIIVLRTGVGRVVFNNIGNKIATFLSYTNNGTELIFGRLATGLLLGPKGNVSVLINGTEQIVELVDNLPMPIQSSIFALTAMPVVIFFSFFVSILYHFGVMQVVVRQLGWLLQVTIGTTACESISASGNIFLGMTESPLLVKPFIGNMTKSELHAVLTGGFATIAGSVMAAYISLGISPSHLLSASVMAAPSALALSKLLYPETEVSRTSIKDIKMDTGSERNAIEAGSNGASSAVGLVSNIIANLIAFVAFLTFLDAMIGWFGRMVNVDDLSFKFILSRLCIPIAYMLGVEWIDCDEIASLIGLKMVINEFVAYQELGTLIKSNMISARSETIVTFALCGFANFGSIGIQVGGLSAIAPERRSDLAEIAMRAMFTGTMANFMTACVGGMLI